MTALACLSIADLRATGGEPRIMDLRLAEALGFERPRNIRKLVERHRIALECFGTIRSTVERILKNKDNSAPAGRPAKAYWLNKKQALYICTKSETEKATEATIEMVEVFDAYMSGVPVRPHTRRRPAPRQQHLLPDLTESRGAIILNGEIVTWDSSDFDVVRGDEVLVILSNGQIEVNQIGGPHGAVVREAQEFGPRTIGSAQRTMTATRRGEVRYLPVRYCGMIIGRVIDRQPMH